MRFLIFTKLYVRLGKNASKSSFDNQLDQLDGVRTGNAVKRRFPKRVLVSPLITQGERKTSGGKGRRSRLEDIILKLEELACNVGVLLGRVNITTELLIV